MKKRGNISILKSLIILVKPMIGYMLLAIILGVLGHLCASFITILGGYALLNYWNLQTFLTLQNIFILVIVLAILRGVLRYGEQAFNHYIAFKVLAHIRDKVFIQLRKLSPARLESKDKGNLITILTSDVELLEVFYAHTISPIMIATIFTIVLVCFIGSYSLFLGALALLAYSVIGIIVPIYISKKNQDLGFSYRRDAGNLSSYVLDSLRGLKEINQYDTGDDRLNRMNKYCDDLSDSEEAMKSILGHNVALVNTLILIFDLLMLIMGLYLYQNQLISLSGVLISTIALMSSFGPVIALANLGSTLQNTLAAASRVIDILEDQPQVNEIEHQPKTSFGDIAVNNISFAYDNETILADFSITLPKGQVMGIVGKSGSGKSTLLKLLMRFWEVNKGEIQINKQNINQINTTDLRNMESYVTQETHLFHDSIINNLKIAKLDASIEEIHTACKKAAIHDFIMSLPNQYETKVAELGDSLSGGEKQRLGLARSFLSNTELMLLDEPTSNLDSLNEAIILKALNEEKNDKTIVLVSHRPSTMKITNKTYQMSEGRIS